MAETFYKNMTEKLYFESLAINDYTDAHRIMCRALDQIRAYLALPPSNISGIQLQTIAQQGKDIGLAAVALEERINAMVIAKLK